MKTKVCENKSDCEFNNICNPGSVNIDVIYNWLVKDAKECEIKLRYIDSKKLMVDLEKVYYKKIHETCSFFFTYDNTNIFLYVTPIASKNGTPNFYWQWV